MKRSIFGVYQLNEIVGAVVLACIGVFIAVLINAGLLKDWFQPSFTLRILLPDEGVSGLAPGAEVQVLGTRAGEVRRIVIDPNQRMHAIARVEDQMRPFIRRDSKVSIRRQFGVAGAAFIDIARGTGPELDWSYAVIAATTDRAATDTLGQMIDEVRAKIAPVLDDVQKAVLAFTAVAQRAVDPAGPLEQTLSSAAGIARRIENGEGVAGRLIANDKMAADLEATLLNVRELAAQLERTSKDPRIGQILDEVRAKVVPLIDDVQKAVLAFTAVAQRAVDPAGPLEQTLASAAGIARRVETGEGVAGRLIANDKMATDLEQTLVNVRELAAQLDQRIAPHNFHQRHHDFAENRNLVRPTYWRMCQKQIADLAQHAVALRVRPLGQHCVQLGDQRLSSRRHIQTQLSNTRCNCSLTIGQLTNKDQLMTMATKTGRCRTSA